VHKWNVFPRLAVLPQGARTDECPIQLEIKQRRRPVSLPDDIREVALGPMHMRFDCVDKREYLRMCGTETLSKGRISLIFDWKLIHRTASHDDQFTFPPAQSGPL
jgi:hypothetical protein